MSAAAAGDLFAAEFLLQAGLKPSHRNKKGQTALQVAEASGFPGSEGVVAVLKAPPRSSPAAERGFTPQPSSAAKAASTSSAAGPGLARGVPLQPGVHRRRQARCLDRRVPERNGLQHGVMGGLLVRPPRWPGPTAALRADRRRSRGRVDRKLLQGHQGPQQGRLSAGNRLRQGFTAGGWTAGGVEAAAAVPAVWLAATGAAVVVEEVVVVAAVVAAAVVEAIVAVAVVVVVVGVAAVVVVVVAGTAAVLGVLVAAATSFSSAANRLVRSMLPLRSTESVPLPDRAVGEAPPACPRRLPCCPCRCWNRRGSGCPRPLQSGCRCRRFP